MNEAEFQAACEQLATQVQSLNARVLQLEQVARSNQELARLALAAAFAGRLQAMEKWAKQALNPANAVELAGALAQRYVWELDRYFAHYEKNAHKTMNKTFNDDIANPRHCWDKATRWFRTALEHAPQTLSTSPAGEGEALDLQLIQHRLEEYRPRVEQWEQARQTWLEERAEAKRRAFQRMSGDE